MMGGPLISRWGAVLAAGGLSPIDRLHRLLAPSALC